MITALPKFETAKERLDKIKGCIPSQPLQSDTDRDAVVAAIHQANEFQEWWTSFTKDAKDSAYKLHRKLCADYESINAPCKQYVTAMKQFVMEYQERKDAELAAQQNAINQDIEKQTPQGVVPLAVTLPKLTAPDGLQRRSTWKARVTDFKKLVKACASGKVPLAALKPACAANEEFDKGNYLDTQARALKAEMVIPGVEAVEVKDFAVRS